MFRCPQFGIDSPHLRKDFTHRAVTQMLRDLRGKQNLLHGPLVSEFRILDAKRMSWQSGRAEKLAEPFPSQDGAVA